MWCCAIRPRQMPSHSRAAPRTRSCSAWRSRVSRSPPCARRSKPAGRARCSPRRASTSSCSSPASARCGASRSCCSPACTRSSCERRAPSGDARRDPQIALRSRAMPALEGSAADVLPAWIVWTRWVLLPVAGYLVARLLARPLSRLTAPPPRDPGRSSWPDNAIALWSVRSVPLAASLLAGVFLYLLAGARGAASAGTGSAVLAALVVIVLLVAAGDEKRGLLRRYGGVALSRR